MGKSKKPPGHPPSSGYGESARTRYIRFREVPKDIAAGNILLHQLGYTDFRVYRVELDRLIATVKGGGAKTFRFQFRPGGRQDAADEVEIHIEDGWPLG